jgi:hypothetical protein
MALLLQEQPCDCAHTLPPIPNMAGKQQTPSRSSVTRPSSSKPTATTTTTTSRHSRSPSKQVAPKSILKKSSSAPSPTLGLTPTITSRPDASRPDAITQTREERNRALAYHHATLIQQRKDTELAILLSLEELIDCPSSVDADPARPLQEDVTNALSQLQPFQPSDFDSLVEERNINEKCGYVLCPRKNRKQGTKGRFRIQYNVNGASGLAGFRVADKADLERWCSEECGRRALWLRVQMSELPAWERVGGVGQLELFKEDEQENRDLDSLVKGVGGMELEQGGAQRQGQSRRLDLVEQMDQLALERGDKSANAFRGKNFPIDLKEKTTSNIGAKPPEPGGSAMAVDGYVPRERKENTRKVQFEDDSDDDEDEDEDEEDVMDTLG